MLVFKLTHVNTLRSRQNGRHFADDTFKRIFLNENVTISIKISLKFVPKRPINNIPALVQIMAGADQATSHYLNQWWLDYWCIYASLGLNELIKGAPENIFVKVSHHWMDMNKTIEVRYLLEFAMVTMWNTELCKGCGKVITCCTVEVWDWINNLISHLLGMWLLIHAWDLSYSMLVKGNDLYR